MSDMLSTSDVEYLQENNPVDIDITTTDAVPVHTQPLTTQSEENVAPLISGNVVSNQVENSNQNQNQYVQSVNVLNQITLPTSANDSPIVTSPVSTANGSLSSALNGLKIINSAGSSKDTCPETSLITGPFEIVGHTTTFQQNGLTDLQIVNEMGTHLQTVPIQVVTTDDNNCAVHFLSIVEEPLTEVMSKDEKAALHPPQQVPTEGNGKNKEITNILFDEPGRASTPAVNMEGLDETILAGNIALENEKKKNDSNDQSLPQRNEDIEDRRECNLDVIGEKQKSANTEVKEKCGQDSTVNEEISAEKEDSKTYDDDVKGKKKKYGNGENSTVNEQINKEKEDTGLRKIDTHCEDETKKKCVPALEKKRQAAVTRKGVNRKQCEITVMKEAEDNTEKHLDPEEKPHNATYCREWIAKSSNQTSFEQIPNAFETNGSDCSLLTKNSTKNETESESFNMTSVSRQVPEVKRQRVLGTLSSNVNKCEPKAKDTNEMYVTVTIFPDKNYQDRKLQLNST